MPQQFLYTPQQEFCVSRRQLVRKDLAEVFTAHHCYVMFCLEKGACCLDLGGESLLVDGSSLVLLGPDLPYRLKVCGGDDAAMLLVEFSDRYLQPLAAAFPACDPAAFLAAEPYRLLNGLSTAAVRDMRFLFTRLLALYDRPAPAPADTAESHLLLAVLLLEAEAQCGNCCQRGDDRRLGQLVQRYIAAHYTEKLDLDALAARFCCSRWHLCHAFKAGTGQSPIEYLNRTRVQAACALLQQEPILSLDEIAHRCGFSGPAQMRRLLKDKTGCSPRQLRRGIHG